MFELLMALAAEPAVQIASEPAEAPASLQSGSLTVSQGGVMAWAEDGALVGSVTVIIDNAGPETDRIVSVRTPAGTVGDIGVYPVVGGRGERAPEGDLNVRPGRTGVLADLTEIVADDPFSMRTTVTVVFEHSGEFTILAVPSFSAPAPPPPAGR